MEMETADKRLEVSSEQLAVQVSLCDDFNKFGVAPRHFRITRPITRRFAPPSPNREGLIGSGSAAF